MNAFLRDGYGRSASVLVAGLFYGAPLLAAQWFGAFDVPEQLSASAWESAGSEYEVHEVAFLPQTIDRPDAGESEAPAEAVAVAVEAAPTPPVKAGGARRSRLTAMVGVPLVDGAGEGTGEGGGNGDGVGDGAGVGVANPKAVGGRSNAKKRRRCDDPHPQVHPGDDGIVEIERALVDQYTKNIEAFMTLGYSRPHNEDDLKGWYISGFSCSSPVHKAGFRRGDVLLSVNGKNTRSWVGVYMMYQKLKNKDAFEVALVRAGKPVTLRFRVVQG